MKYHAFDYFDRGGGEKTSCLRLRECMFWTVLFSILIVLIVLRAAVLHRRKTAPSPMTSRGFRPKSNSPCSRNACSETLRWKISGNLDSFPQSGEHPFDTDAYRPLLQQLRVAGEENAIALDEDIYEKETRILDALSPLEFAKAKVERKKGNETGRRAGSRRHPRCYSDEK